MFETKTYALILESQGFFKEALEIYKKINSTEDIKRLSKKRKIEGVNILKLKEFENIDEKNRYEFEKYLKDLKWI